MTSPRFAVPGQIGMVFLLAWAFFPEFARAQQADSPSAVTLRKHARDVHNSRRYDLAVEHWETITSTHPDTDFAAEAYYYTGICYRELKLFEKATKKFQRVVEAYPGFPLSEDAHLNLGWCQFYLGNNDVQQYAAAAATLNNLLDNFPNGKHRDEALYFLGESYYHLGEKANAAQAYQRLVDHHRESKLWRDALYALGVASAELGRFKEARLAYDMLIKEFPNDELINEVRLRRAESLLQTGDAEAAERVFAMLAAVDGFELADHAMLRQAFSAQQEGKFAQAAELYAALTKTFPSSDHVSIATTEAARCYYRAKMSEQVVTWLVGSAKAGRKEAFEAAHLLCRKYLQDHEPARALGLAEALLIAAGEITSPDVPRPSGEGLREGPGDEVTSPTALKPPEEIPFLVNLKLRKADALVELPKRRAEAMTEYLATYSAHRKHALAPQALYKAAFTALKLTQYDEVRKLGAQFQEHFENNELIPDAKGLLAECDLAEKKYAEAEDAFDALVKSHPEHPEIETWIVRRGLCQYEQAKFKEVIDSLNSSMARLTAPDLSAEAQFLVGASHLQMGQAKDAATALSTSLKTKPKWSRTDETLLFLSLSQRQLDELEHAITTVEQLITEFPESSMIAQAYYRLGEFAWAARDYPKAITAFDRVIQQSPESPFVPVAYLNKGIAQAESSDHAISALSFKAFIEKHPKHVRVGEARLRRAFSLLQLSKYRDAIAEVRILLKSNPSEPHKSDALYMRGLAETGLKDYATAASTFQAILAENPDYPDSAKVLNQLALTYRELDEHEKAFATFADLAAKYPDSPAAAEAHFHAAEGHFNAKRLEEAVKSYSAAKHSTNSAEIDELATHRLGWVYYQQEQFEVALVEFTAQVETHANGKLLPEGLFMRAEALFRLNDFKRAFPAFVASVSNLPSDENYQMLAFLHGAQSASRLEQWSEAVKLIDQLLERFPETPYLPSAAFERGFCKQKLEIVDEAIEDYQIAAAHSRDESGARARFMIGQIHCSRNNYAATIKNFRLVMFGYGGKKASEDVRNWQARAGLEAGRCAEAEISNRTGDARSEAVSAAQSFYEYVIESHGTHELAQEARDRLGALPSGQKSSAENRSNVTADRAITLIWYFPNFIVA